MARPRKKIDPEMVEKLASIACTQEEIAYVMGCSVDTLHRRFADIIKKGGAYYDISLRRAIKKKVDEGSVPMIIFMSKQRLGYSDKVDQNLKSEPIQNITYKTELGGSDFGKDTSTLQSTSGSKITSSIQ